MVLISAFAVRGGLCVRISVGWEFFFMKEDLHSKFRTQRFGGGKSGKIKEKCCFVRVRGSTWPSGQSGIMLLATGGSPRFVFVLRRGASRFFGQWSCFCWIHKNSDKNGL